MVQAERPVRPRLSAATGNCFDLNHEWQDLKTRWHDSSRRTGAVRMPRKFAFNRLATHCDVLLSRISGLESDLVCTFRKD